MTIAARAEVTERRRWVILWVLLAGIFSTGFSITLLVVSLARIADELDSSVATLTWVITAPMLAFGVVGPAFGKAGDLWGHKRIFVGGLVGAAVFSLLSVFTWSAGSLIVFRTLAATAGSACGPSGMAYVNRLFEGRDRVKALGYWSFVGAGAPVVGVVAGGPLIEAIGWRSIFAIQAPLCLVALIVAWWLVPTTERLANVRFDVLGSLTIGVGSASLLAAISQGRHWGWVSVATLSCLAVAVASLVVFVAVERRAAAPLVVLDWFRTRNFAFPVLSQSLCNFVYMGSFFLIPQVLGASGLGLGEATIGYLVIARPLAFSLVAPLAARLTMRVGERVSGVLGALGMLVSMLMWTPVGHGTSYVYIVVATAFSGIGSGLLVPALTVAMASAVDPADLGVAGAMQQLGTQMGAVLGSAVVATVCVTATPDDLSSFHAAFLVAAAVAVATAITALFVRRTSHSLPAT